ncbi:stearoyl-CoA desaturase [Aethina tumida]|uniref:stearoyl-CoA desaturase n=1 Tax=Aethina tumida TaxID=116153 RepID=UPI00096B3486|nr:stearoyl-CoA desaturase [Aethina tumida]
MAPRIPETESSEPKSPGYYSGKLAHEIGTDPNYRHKWYKKSMAFHGLVHLSALYGLYLCATCIQLNTFLWTFALGMLSGESITMGAHRLYSHRSFKASFSLRLALNIFQLLSGQNSMYTWVRDHRLHHKFSDTDADPHNAERGFFFSHMGWLMTKKHPAVKEKYKTIDMSDLEADEIVMFQYKYFLPLYFLFSIFIPMAVPIYFFGESFWTSLFVCYFMRYCLSLNVTWTVNSLAHMFGYKPFDKYIKPCENWFVSFIALGEGWHNYHHAFPWDYKASEYGVKINLTTHLINMLAYFGHAHGLRTASDTIIASRIQRTGESSDKTSADELPKDVNEEVVLATSTLGY